jgi:hypothetical protein
MEDDEKKSLYLESMNGYRDEIVAEVRGNRAKLLEIYGGIEGLQKHMKEERPQLEKEGWQFISAEAFSKRNTVSTTP